MSMKRLICLLVTILLVVELPLSLVYAASYTDFPMGWSARAMTAAVENGLLTGYEDGAIRPETNLTRAQVATIITRAFGAQTTADISAFSDVPADAWFAPYISKAVKMGALNGTSATTMGPDLPITREQVFTAVGRILVLSSDNASVLNKFNDAGTISSWAAPYMSALVERGYVNGDNFGNVNPKAYITREEFAQFMYNAIRTYITEPGTYDAPLEGITVIRVPNVIIQGVSATSDLVVGDGVGTGSITLKNVRIEKRLLARGGTIFVSNGTNGEGVVVNNVNGITQFMNYRTDPFFARLTENTKANFLSYSPSFGGSSSGGHPTPDDDEKQHTLKFYLFENDTSPFATVVVDNGTTLGGRLPTPTEDDVLGYEFLGWFDSEDETKQIKDTTAITEGMKVVAKLAKETYYVKFLYDTVGKEAVSLNYTTLPYDSTRAAYQFDIDTYMSVLPVEDQIDIDWTLIDSNQRFKYWKKDNGDKADKLPVTGAMKTGDVVNLFAHFLPIDEYIVSFYSAYPVGSNTPFRQEAAKKEDGYTVVEANIPNTENYKVHGYKKDKNVADVYDGKEQDYYVLPSHWYESYTYVCQNCSQEHVGAHKPLICSNCSAAASELVVTGKAELVPFDETVVVSGDMNVFCLSQYFSVIMKFEEKNNSLFGVVTPYSDDTRVADSSVMFLLNLGDQLDDAIGVTPSLIPNYDAAMNKLKEKLVSSGLTDESMNIQVSSFQTKISTLVSRQTAEKMIKDYIQNAIENPDELDPILEWIDLSDFVSGMDNQKILELIHQNEGQVVSAVLDDLSSNNPALLQWIVDYVKGDGDAQETIASALITKIKNGFTDAELAEGGYGDVLLDVLRERQEIVDLIVEKIKAKDAELISLVVEYVKADDGLIETLVATLQDTTKGAALRTALLTNASLAEFLKDNRVKSAVIDEMLTDEMINKVWSSSTTDVKEALLVEAVKNADFLHALIESDTFKAFILDSIHDNANLKADVKEFVGDNETAILQKFSDDADFRKLFEKSADPSNPNALRAELLKEIKIDDYIPAAEKEGFLKYIFGITDANKFPAFLDDALLTNIRNNYNSDFGSLDQSTRQALYDAKKDDAWSVVLTEFEEYKEATLTAYVTSGLAGLTDTGLKTIVDAIFLRYLDQFIENNVPTELEGAKTAIGDILIDYLREALANPAHGSKAEKIFEDIKTVFHTKHEIDATFVISFIQDADNKVQFKNVATNAYSAYVEPLAELIKAEGSTIRTEIDAMLCNMVADTLETVVKTFINKTDAKSKALITDLIAQYAGTTDGVGMISDYLKSNKLNNKTLAGQLKRVLNAPDAPIDDIKDELITFIKTDTSGLLETAIKQLAKNNDTTFVTTLESFVNGIDLTFVANNRTKILEVLDSILNATVLKSYISGITDKIGFANEIFAEVKEMPMFDAFMDALMDDEFFTVTPENAGMIQVISERIRGLTFESVMEQTNNATIDKVIDLIGNDAFKVYYEETRNGYCDGLDAVIQTVKDNDSNGIVPAERTYTTALTIRVDLMEILQKMYDKAAGTIANKLANANVHYGEDDDDNEYLWYLVNHNVMTQLFDYDASKKSDTLTGYSLKTVMDNNNHLEVAVMDYYNYLAGLFIVADDALRWYGENGDGQLSDAEFEAVYDALLSKIYKVHGKLNEILEDYTENGDLPSRVQGLLDQVKQLNSLLTRFESQITGAINKYLGSNINEELENGTLGDNEKFQKMVDFLVGSEEPTISINTLYDLFYQYDENLQAKLQKLIDSGKLEAAIEKFESTDIGAMFDGKGRFGGVADKIEELKNSADGKIHTAFNSIYDFLVLVAKHGLEPYRVDQDKVNVLDSYEVKIGGVTLKVVRNYRDVQLSL